MVPSQPLPQEFFDLDWIWEDDTNFSKLLGMFIGTKIAPLLTHQATSNILEDVCSKLENLPTHWWMGPIASQFINNAIWYLMTSRLGTTNSWKILIGQSRILFGVGRKVVNSQGSTGRQ